MRVGIAGIGKMGAAIATRLRDTGVDVCVWNRTVERAVSTGLPVADNPADLARRSDFILSSVFDEKALEDVFYGPNGLIEGARGKLFIEMSTVRPMAQKTLALAIADAGGAFIECPVGGTTEPALAGKLLGLAGGAQVDFDRGRPVLERLCRRVELMGPVGH